MAMSVNAASALHAAANWYDFSKSASSEAAAIASLSNFLHKQQTDTGMNVNHRGYQPHASSNSNNEQFASIPQNHTNQYNSQFQQSSLNSLFASSTAPLPPKKDSLQSSSRNSSSSYNLTGQYPNNGATNTGYSKSAVSQSMPRSTSSNSINEPLVTGGYGLTGTTSNTQHQQMHGGTYQYGSNYQMASSTHQHYQGMQDSSVQSVGHQGGHFNTYGSQFNQSVHSQAHHPGHHHPLGSAASSVLNFPNHHHQAMNNLLANQFSNVAPFNWHPKI